MAVIVLNAIVFFLCLGGTYLFYIRRKNERSDLKYFEKMSLDGLLKVVKIELAEMVKDDDAIIANDINFEAIIRNKRRAEIALTDCVYGIESAKLSVIALIRNILEREVKSIELVNEVIDFSYLRGLEPMVKFELLLYRLRKTKGKDVISYLDSKYEISQARTIRDPSGERKRRLFDYKLLDSVFYEEIESEVVTYSEALDILAILIYQKYKGFGCIDSLRELNIDGLHFGTSGSIRYEIDGKYDATYRSVNSVWVQIRTNWVHFSFLDFYKEGEMKRITNQLVAWGSTAPMSEKNPKKVNDMADGSRVTTLRPPAAECWACFIRKFTLSVYSVETLLNKPTINNWELPAKLLYYLMKAEQTTAFTGMQNTGKTSIMKAIIEYVELINIRVLEMSFELALRENYPDIDVFTVKPTDYISSSQLQDVLKKTDAYLSMVGEVAEDVVAARMIQFCLVASAFTLFSHHGKDDYGLINGLSNSLVASGEYSDHSVAMSTVLDAIKHNCHLCFVDAERPIEYISEIVKENEVLPYPALPETATVQDAINAYTRVTTEYYTRVTDRVRFTSRKIVVFDFETKTYRANEWYTDEMSEKICRKLPPEEREGFIQFYKDNWGGRENG